MGLSSYGRWCGRQSCFYSLVLDHCSLHYVLGMGWGDGMLENGVLSRGVPATCFLVLSFLACIVVIRLFFFFLFFSPPSGQRRLGYYIIGKF